MTSLSSSCLSPCASSSQTSTNQHKSCTECFENLLRTPDCPLIPNKQRKRLIRPREASLRGPQPWNAAPNGEPPTGYPGARRDHCYSNRNMSSTQIGKQLGAGKHQKSAPFKKLGDGSPQLDASYNQLYLNESLQIRPKQKP